MGDVYQQQWVETLRPRLKGPVLEVGSKRIDGSPDFFDYRPMFKGLPYVGVDIEAGPGVDRVVDLGDPAFEPGDLGPFNTVLCLSTLEHVREPWRLAQNLTTLLKRRGVLVVSVPFVWIQHNHPDDYWRFTPSGVKALFPTLKWNLRASFLHTSSGRTIALSDPGAERVLTTPALARVKLGFTDGTEYTGMCQLDDSFLGEGCMVDMVGRRP